MEKAELGYVWQFVADLGNGRQLSINGNFNKDASAEVINKEVDKIRSVVDRQQAKAASMGAEQEIEQLILRKASAEEDLAMIDTKNEAKGSLTAQERSQREAAIIHLSKMGKDIEYKKGVLAKLQAEAK